MTTLVYQHRVEAEGTSGVHRTVLYDGPDIALAIAAWSKAVSEGDMYVVLESLIAADPLPEPGRVAITVQHGSKMAEHDGFPPHDHAHRSDHIWLPRS